MEVQEGLRELASAWGRRRVAELLKDDRDRVKRYGMEAAGLRLDFSRHLIDEPTLEGLLALAEARDLAGWRERLFEGDTVNPSEGRAALHMALRAPDARDWRVQGRPVAGEVRDQLERMLAFVDDVHSDGRFTDVLSIGIGGSHLGPEMVATALPADPAAPRVHFLSNVDPAQFERLTAGLDPARTLCVVVSKTFTTRETMLNAEAARDWVTARLGAGAVADHFAAVSTNNRGVTDFGIRADRQFLFWDWVGGRYSLWSAVGLGAALHLGVSRFRALLDGAAAMDRHFETAPAERNAPLLAGLLAVWYRDYLHWPSHAVIPYSDRLRLFPAHLQQLEMESLGKQAAHDGGTVPGRGGAVLWGGTGTDAQHAFFQLIHQGRDPVPVDFILPLTGTEASHPRQRVLAANCLAQAQALCEGRPAETVRRELEAEGRSPEAVEALVPQRSFPGNRPSSLLMLPALDARHLGALTAFYEHRVFVQACLWRLNPFDQWGVELGKTLARVVEPALTGRADESELDPATRSAVDWIWKGPR
jgi:glucose-6-phosphate isomerase